MKRYVSLILLLFVIVSLKAQYSYNKPFSSTTNYNSLKKVSFFNEDETEIAKGARSRMGGVQKYTLLIVGIQGGANMCNLMGTTLKGNTFAFGYNGGFFINVWHEEIVSLHIEVNYTQFGYKNTLNTQTINYTEDSAISTLDRVTNNMNEIFHCITLPILARFAFGSDVKFFIDLGPYVSYTFLAHEKGDITTQTSVTSGGIQTMTTPLEVPINRDFKEIPVIGDIKTGFNKFDVGATGGIGLKFYTGLNEYKFYPYVFIEARFSYGFLSLLSPYDEIAFPDNPRDPPFIRKVHPMLTRYNITLNAGIGMPF